MIQEALRVYRLQLYVIFSGLLLMWTITPFGKQVTGFGIGLAVSAYCLWLLARRGEKLGKSIVMKEKAPGLGVLNRFAAAILELSSCMKLSMKWKCGHSVQVF